VLCHYLQAGELMALPFTLNNPALSVFSVMQAWLMNFTGLDINHVIQGRQNGLPLPTGPFIIMTQVQQKGLSTFDATYNFTAGTEAVNMAFDFVIQCDCYGVGAGDVATMLSTMFASEPGADFFDAYVAANALSAMEPLYAEDPLSMAFSNEEQQYEQRYIVKCHINVTNAVTIPMQSMTAASVNLVNLNTVPR
jgi:hypothetical protein